MKKLAKPPQIRRKRRLLRLPKAVSKPLNSRKRGVERPLATLRYVHSPKNVRAWLGLSLADVGREIARLTKRPRAYDKAAVWHWEQGNMMTAQVREAYGVMVANKLTVQLGRMVGVKLVANSPWTLTAWAKCIECGTWFELRRRDRQRCEVCVQSRKGAPATLFHSQKK
jgi:hypothetical protein